MVSNLKELIRWLAFIPVPLIIGPLVGALILIPIFFIFPNIVETGPDIPTKLILTSIMWIVIFWFGAFLKPNNLTFLEISRPFATAKETLTPEKLPGPWFTITLKFLSNFTSWELRKFIISDISVPL